jgi:mitochondrial enoyl-[acyl-carrier protein] reductase / trans-2-enoyl-CoA reductase
MKKVTAIVYGEYGTPADVLRIEEQELPAPQAGQALVEMRAAPINPADLNTIEGKYPVRPELPATPGVEGAGVVTVVGPGVASVKVGDMVLLPHRVGTWREASVVAADDLSVVPAGVPVEEAAMLKINPATAWRMLHDYVDLKPGDWVIQNAANSGVGRAVIRIARALGLKTVNIVRRPELIEELQAEGGDKVLVDSPDNAKQLRDLKIALALNAVGGESAVNIANALRTGGTVVTYGAMSRQPLKIPNGLVIFKELRFRGCWVTAWYQRAGVEEKREMFGKLFGLVRDGVLKTKVERAFPLSDWREAIDRAGQGQREGKIIFRMGA